MLSALSNRSFTPWLALSSSVIAAAASYLASATGPLVVFALGIIAQAILAGLLASAIAATIIGRWSSAMSAKARCFVPCFFTNRITASAPAQTRDRKYRSPTFVMLPSLSRHHSNFAWAGARIRQNPAPTGKFSDQRQVRLRARAPRLGWRQAACRFRCTDARARVRGRECGSAPSGLQPECWNATTQVRTRSGMRLFAPLRTMAIKACTPLCPTGATICA